MANKIVCDHVVGWGGVSMATTRMGGHVGLDLCLHVVSPDGIQRDVKAVFWAPESYFRRHALKGLAAKNHVFEKSHLAGSKAANDFIF